MAVCDLIFSGTPAKTSECRRVSLAVAPSVECSDSSKNTNGRRHHAVKKKIQLANALCWHSHHSHPLNKTQSDEFGGRNAVLEIFQECFAVERVQLVKISEQDVGVTLKPSGYY